MKTPNLDVDPFIEALRVDLPSADDEARVRARFLAAGVVVAGAAVTTSSGAASLAAASAGPGTTVGVPGALNGAAVSSAAVSSAALSGAAGAAGGLGAAGTGAIGGLGAGAPVAALEVGLLSKVLVLPAAAKLGIVTSLAVAVAATSVPLVLSSHEPEASAGSSATVSRAAPRDRTAPSALTSRGPIADARAVDGARHEAASAQAASSGPAPGVVSSDELTASGSATSDANELNDGVGNRAGASGDVNALPDRRQATVKAPRSSVADRPPARLGAASRLSKAGSRRAGATAESSVADSERSSVDRRSPRDADSFDRGRTEMVHTSTLGEETRLLEQAMSALGEGDRSVARRSLEEHARRFPEGLLVRERERALERLRQLAADPH